MDRPQLGPDTKIHTDDSGTWGLYKWKDGFIGLLKLHRSGYWFLVRPATTAEIQFFKNL